MRNLTAAMIRCTGYGTRGLVIVAGALIAAGIAAFAREPALLERGDLLPETLQLTALNAVPAALLLLMLFSLTRRMFAATALALGIYLCLLTVNALKIDQLGLPLLPADFRFLNYGGGLNLFAHYLQPEHVALPLGLLVVGLVALALEPAQPLRLPACTTLGGASLVATIGLITGAAPWPRLYDGQTLGFEPWSPSTSAAHSGLVPSLLLYRWTLRPDRRAPDRERALEFIAEHVDALGTSDPYEPTEQPDIVVVQSESFFDASRLNGVAPTKVLANFRHLAAQGRSGDLHVPTFGGGTIRTEFEVLTGVPLAVFPAIDYPYFDLLDAPAPGLARDLTARGYRTLALHPNDAGFWNRGVALARLGFERFLALPEFNGAALSGFFVSDAALTEHILAELRDDGPPQFLFAISIEAHGPYDVSPNLDPTRLAAMPVPSGLDEYGERTLRNYLYHLDAADRALGQLADALLARRRPTILLFYGDHLPGLHSSFAQTGFADGRSGPEQPVPWLLLDNRARRIEREDLHAWMLPAVLLDAADIHGDIYFTLLAALRRTPAALLPGGDTAPPEPRFAEIARLRARDELDALNLAAVRTPPPVPTGIDASPGPITN